MFPPGWKAKGETEGTLKNQNSKGRMALQNWEKVFNEQNVDVATYHLETQFLSVLDQLAPLKKFQPRGKRSDWVSNDTKRIMKLRDEARNKAVQSSLQEEWSEYKTLRNLCTKKVKADRNENLKRHFQRLHDTKDSKGLFNLASKKMGCKKAGAPELFVVNGIKTPNPKEMANIQLEAFHGKVRKLIQQLPPQLNDPLCHLKLAIQRWGKAAQVPELILQHVSVSQVVSIIKDLNGSHAFGHEGIDTSALKLVGESVAAPIADIINKSISARKFPNRWKFGRLIPLYKGGKKDRLDPGSFRPISMLPAISKVTEKFVQSQIVQHMDKHGLWHGSIHSYRKFHSSTTALAQVTDSAIEASEEKKISTAIAIDESAAFDTLNHEIMLRKLKMYRLHDNTIEWVKNYLTARTEYVSLGGQDSAMRQTVTGVPQGSILGPTLFNIYINEFPEIVKDQNSCESQVHIPGEKLFGRSCNICGNLTTFADDAVYVTSHSGQRREPEKSVTNPKENAELLERQQDVREPDQDHPLGVHELPESLQGQRVSSSPTDPGQPGTHQGSQP